MTCFWQSHDKPKEMFTDKSLWTQSVQWLNFNQSAFKLFNLFRKEITSAICMRARQSFVCSLSVTFTIAAILLSINALRNTIDIKRFNVRHQIGTKGDSWRQKKTEVGQLLLSKRSWDKMERTSEADAIDLNLKWKSNLSRVNFDDCKKFANLRPSSNFHESAVWASGCKRLAC